MSQSEGKVAIDKLVEIYEKVEPYIVQDDKEWVTHCIDFYQIQFDKGLFADEYSEQMLNMKWGEVNFRHQHNSVVGFGSEVWGAGLWNKYNPNTKMRFVRGDKKIELGGGDLYATNPKWYKGFPAQVKTVNDVDYIKIYDSYLQYSPRMIQRIIFSDPVHHKILHLDYETFQQYCLGKDVLTFQEAKRHIKNVWRYQ